MATKYPNDPRPYTFDPQNPPQWFKDNDRFLTGEIMTNYMEEVEFAIAHMDDSDLASDLADIETSDELSSGDYSCDHYVSYDGYVRDHMLVPTPVLRNVLRAEIQFRKDFKAKQVA